MARIGGRSLWAAWPVGLLCAAVVAALLWLSLPLVPASVQWAGDALRGPTSRPAAEPAATVAGVAEAPLGTKAQPSPSAPAATDSTGCRALYTSAQWSELTARTGGAVTEDASAPSLSAPNVITALAPAVRITCTWAATTTGRITTTVADVGTDADGIAQAALGAQGFGCGGFGDGIRCTRTDGDSGEDVVVRGGVWLSTVFESWRPTLYTERVAEQLWGN